MKTRNIITLLCALLPLALLPMVQGAPETALPGFNTADGDHALSNVSSGVGNSGFGWYSLFSNSTNNFGTAVGAGALALNAADDNTAVGAVALLLNTTGSDNVAVGAGALVNNNDGSDNNAVGAFALNANVSGNFNNAHGRDALFNCTGDQNNAFGDLALENVTTGGGNSGFGDDALDSVTTGNENVGVGDEAGNSIVDGSNNVCIGFNAGVGIVSASNSIAIGVPAAGPFADLNNTCFIGSIFNEPVSDPGTATAVFVDQFNVLGFNPSTRRVKHDIHPMDNASERLYALKPVTFKYNGDKKGVTQFGLIAEDVAAVDPALVLRDKTGHPETIRYEQINAMLLNEFLKEHKKVEQQQSQIEKQQATIADLQVTVAEQRKSFQLRLAEQQKQIEALTSGLQRVSAQLELNRAKPQSVADR